MGSPKPRHSTPVASEDEVLERIRDILGNGIGPFGLRDDAAVVDVPGGGSVVVSVDSSVEGVHVDLSVCSAADLGWKAMMGALSDLAAMGASPLGSLVALCVPGGSGQGEVALGVMGGVAEASTATGCPVVGGDVSAAGELVVAVTVLGTVEGDAAAVSRSGASAGDALLVTGPCGGSAAGLRELRAGAGSGASSGGGCLPATRGPPARGRSSTASGSERHDRHLRRLGARPAPAGRRLRRWLRVGVGPRRRRGDARGGARRRRGLRAGDRRLGQRTWRC